MSVARINVNKLRDIVSLRDFGAVGDGIADDTAAFNAAIAYANSRGGVDAANITGTTIVVPDGRYKITATLATITKSGCEFVGESKNGAVLLCAPNTTTFVFGDGVNTCVGGGVSRVKIEYTSAPLAAVFARIDYGFRLRFDDLLLVNIGTLLSLGVSNIRIAGGIGVSRVNGYVANGGVPLFDLRYGAGLFLTDVTVFVGGVVNPTHPANMTTAAGTHVFKCDVGSWDTLQAVNCLFERFDIGLACTPPANNVYQNFFFSNVIFDYLRRWCVYAETNAAGSAISTIKFDQSCWFVSWEEDAIALIRSAGFNDNHSISGTIAVSGKYGIKYQISNGETNSFENMQINGCNRLGLVASCLQFESGSRGFTVTNVKGNNDATIGWTRPNFGIVVAADCDEFFVSNCALEGPTGGYSFATNATGSSQRRAFNNLKANYAGYIAASMPASTVSYVNKSPFVEEWNFFGGTITSGYDKNGQGFPGALSSLHIRLQPNDSFSCGYSVAPTVVVFVEP